MMSESIWQKPLESINEAMIRDATPLNQAQYKVLTEALCVWMQKTYADGKSFQAASEADAREQFINQVKAIGISPEVHEKITKQRDGLQSALIKISLNNPALMYDHCKNFEKVLVFSIENNPVKMAVDALEELAK